LSRRDDIVLLLLFAVMGFFLGHRFGMSGRGFVTMGVISIGATVAQIAHLATAADRSSMTMLPIVIGAIMVAGMLLGAYLKQASRSPNAA
jgi:hypothetical protein